MLKVGSQRFLWAVRGYRPKKNCPQGQFRSKVELAVQIVREAAACFPHGSLTVLMDSWYACAGLLTTIQAAGWTYLAAVRANRLVVLSGSPRKQSVRSLAKSRHGWQTVRAGKKRRYRVRRRRAWLPRVGDVLVFVVVHGREVRGFVTNDLGLSEAAMVRLYGQRWWIETLHRELKQHVGFGELFVRQPAVGGQVGGGGAALDVVRLGVQPGGVVEWEAAAQFWGDGVCLPGGGQFRRMDPVAPTSRQSSMKSAKLKFILNALALGSPRKRVITTADTSSPHSRKSSISLKASAS